MKLNFFKRIICFALILIIAIPATVFGENGNASDAGAGVNADVGANGANGGNSDDRLMQTETVEGTYVGREQAHRLIQQLQFNDLPANAAVQDAIIRSHALEIMRPGSAQFRPNALVTREEAITYALRAAGLSDMALTMATAQASDLPEGTPLGTAWSVGYLQLASTMGMITTADFDAARADIIAQFSTDEPAADGEQNNALADAAQIFRRNDPATREEIAFWVVTAMQFAQSDIFANTTAGRSVQSFTDWNSISAEMAPAVELALRHNILNGQTSTVFGPSGNVQRQHMAGILRNIDDLHYTLRGLERRMGTVADILHEQHTETGAGTLWRHIRVRRADGGVDNLQFALRGGPSPQAGPLDAVVLRGGHVMGLGGLEINDQIEYIVHTESNTIVYVNVGGTVQTQIFRGRLELINMEEGTMTFRNDEGTVFTFPMSLGLYGEDHNDVPFIRMRGNILEPAEGLPRGTFYNVTLVGNVITQIEFVGDPVLVPEHRGLVIENNAMFGYLTILDANREEQSFTYNPGELTVQRRQFFDMRDTIGGFHEMFPSVRAHPRDANMEDVIPGDIVVFRVAEDDPFRIIEISAAENTTTRYGRIREIRDQGGFFDILVEFNNGVTTWYTFVDNILVTELGRPVNPNRIQLGDWVRMTVNQAILAPGEMMESVRDITIDTGGHHINTIMTGQLAGFNAAQNTIQIQHARELTPAGWRNHSPLTTVNISGPNVRYYHDGRAVTLAQVNRYLQRSDATVYLALENHFAGERAKVVSVRSGRDELIRSGTVLSSANNRFSLLEIDGDIRTDAGTIVVRNGRLVEPEHIFAPDWARVAMNGNSPGIAAVVDIGPAPDVSGIQIVRGRVSQVWPFEGFRVTTMSIFDGFRWNFTPIEREFTIDHNTMFINSGGVTSIDDFIGHTDNSVIGDVFNVIVEGGRAVRVIDAPFTAPIPQTENSYGHLTVRGIIYEISGNTFSLRDMTVYNASTGGWQRISNVDPTGSVTTFANTIIVDRNEVIPANRLRVGQQIMAFGAVGRNTVEIEPGLSADAYIVFVEN
ncbi:MAG: S-layer homology domain-containing protein [Defluviitaleaceae bacterium]|nr:S-layer homology domain-containing protein [Defluviitaleaceae bacterium]